MMIDDPDWVTKSCEKPLSISPVKENLAFKNTKIFSFLLFIKDFKVSMQTLVYWISS
jgi:hypothetical protein